MFEQLKILIIRLSSIGDIVLTTPLIRCLKQQKEAQIHYLTKNSYLEVIKNNPYIDKTFTLEKQDVHTINKLKKEHYDYVIDLQNNLRSYKVKKVLHATTYTVSKQNIKRYILIYFGANLLKNHVVDRYFKTIEKLNIENDKKGVDYFIDKKTMVEFNINQKYISWSIGGAYNNKKLSINQVCEVSNSINIPIVLIGGEKEKKDAKAIIDKSENKNIISFCGEISLEESAYLIKHSNLFLTNDTGTLHIATAFNVPLLSFWGCTKPSLGFSPYSPKNVSKMIVPNNSNKPCSKHGKYCRFNEKGCVKTIDTQQINYAINNLLK